MRFAYAWGLVLVWPVAAAAHIHLTTPQSRTDMLTGDQKEEHCGVLNQTRTTRVTTYKPGETVMVSWAETINHTGWFRISFQPNGQVFEIPPPSNGPDGTGAAGVYPTENLTGMTDTASGSIILADRIADGQLMQQITLPNMECNNCTLQFIQVMTDKKPYTADAASDDVAMVLRYERRVRAKIFLYSSLPADELAERVRAAGLDGYIEKDHGLEHLVTRVGEILKRAK